ncbi:MAG: hypothetical protein L0H03_23315, partial [Rhodococcus sp. (in: high G+C Gram-positive bacteria)]|nr:hypothetical protein [Rhodococcus sp. (in: high G+C Gram-positive bacteria)]
RVDKLRSFVNGFEGKSFTNMLICTRRKLWEGQVSPSESPVDPLARAQFSSLTGDPPALQP